MQRRLTVIFCADMAGYSALMERDEAGTLARLKAVRGDILVPRLAAHSGRVVKWMGDGVLAEFSSVVAALTCACEIQEALTAQNAGLAFRIGVNLGEVIVEGEDLYGDGVNVAARLQELAEPGAVAVSQSVRDQAAGKADFGFRDLGEHALKNIARPIRVFGVGTGAAPAPAPVKRDERVSICVLPFANMSGDPEQEYFSDGVTEDILTNLSQISALAVAARHTAFALKGAPIDIVQTARRLGVSHVLEGSVRKAGNRVRITAQLIDGESGNHIWAERYDRELDDIFAVQDEISEAIAAALKLRLLPSEKQAIEQRSTSNPEAYQAYLMARQFVATASARHRPIIVRLCKRAVELDPGYARAWALLALNQANMRVTAMSGEDNGWEAAERALALDPGLAEAHAAKGRALAEMGRYEESWAEHQLALRADPNSYDVLAAAARCAVPMRNWDEAIRLLERAAVLVEHDFWALGMAIQCYLAKDETQLAQSAARRCLARVEKAITAEPDNGTALSFGVTSLMCLGEMERAKDWIRRALLLDPDNINLRYNVACGLIMNGETEAGLDLLEQVFAVAKSEGVQWMKGDSDLDPVRAHPRYRAALAGAEARNAAEDASAGADAGGDRPQR